MKESIIIETNTLKNRMDNPKTKAIRGTRHRTMTNETKKKKEKKTYSLLMWA
jgi:hypothetical protein